ncbi:hypothetical protein BJX63DRAFT_46167 [Aspergillus granulosus]|uniref:Uncharacterized protein n=1 Tax=Aspergillus granulosus TaxID=176169 RepID=A0ABR4HTR5_9EURO
MISSQSMLLDYEGSITSNDRVSAQESLASIDSPGRSDGMSLLSDTSQLCYVPDMPGIFEVSDARCIIPYHEGTPGSMERVSEEVMELLRSQESSSIIPLPASPVRRRFTIDDQAEFERQERFMRSPLVAEPLSGLGFEGTAGAFNQRGDAIKPSSPMSAYPQFTWLPDPDRSRQRTESNGINARSSMAPIRQDQRGTNFSRSSRDVAPMTIFGQPVAFQGIGMRVDNHAVMRPLALRDMEFDDASRVWCRRV